ncbi:BTAD domain-containing putative transcriptional regulator [Kitasatospora sp. DSM 101779]|uniref:AfsR/SARP family transcriptional regulator n=1 Tax=Kitasatospora sp. DSM 101779 TaxID=2853165 RepID=UPI0021DADD7F|nr:BTAD domain-containing putative transcriptional regulator [Kitasatospora sp. DSM 101779]MCU7825989.1 AAA family ATPase [Kitasatospora sp. DSM 101779]
MHIDLLGPVVVRRPDGAVVTPSALKRRALLCALAVNLNRTVSTGELIELVWDGAAPPTALAALQGHVAALRRLLDGPGFALETRGSGYLLAGDPERVDVLRFARLCEETAALPGEPVGPAAAARGGGPVPLLRTALDLWRGPALADCGSVRLRERELPHLTGLRLDALERLAENLLRAGRGGEAVARLTEVADAHPSRRTLATMLVRCLQQDGRHLEARERFDRMPVRPAGPPGARPRGTGTPPVARPPVPDRHFCGRSLELARLDEALPAARTGRPVLVTGPAGAGKTALVRYWAAQRAGHFPDGILDAALGGFGPAGPREPADVLGGFLTALGVAPDDLPASTAERSRRYRELVAGRRMVVLLDDAASREQILPLLPDPPPPGAEGAGPTPVAVVTSRSRLHRLLVHEGGVPVPLGALTHEDAVTLLAGAWGPDRAEDAPGVAELIERCERLPLALRLAAARLAARPDWSASALADELADPEAGLTALSGAGSGPAAAPAGLVAALDRTHRTLAPPAARLFALLGLHPGEVIDTGAAAALAGTPRTATRTLLAELDAVHLLDEAAPGRYTRRESVRRYAARYAAELGRDERSAALDRLIDHYLDVTADWTAACAADGGPASIRGAFEKEEGGLRALVLLGERNGPASGTWRLAHRTALLHEETDHDRSHWRTVAEAGLRAARAGNDDAAVARLGTDLAVLHTVRAAHHAAAVQLELAVAAADRAGDEVLRHDCRSRVAAALLRTGQHCRALPMLVHLVEAARTPPTAHLLVPALTGLADALVMAGEPGPALAHADEAVRAATTRSEDAAAVLALHSRARALHALGRREAAISSARLAVALGRTAGVPAAEKRANELLADLLGAIGRGLEGPVPPRRAATPTAAP